MYFVKVFSNKYTVNNFRVKFNIMNLERARNKLYRVAQKECNTYDQ